MFSLELSTTHGRGTLCHREGMTALRRNKENPTMTIENFFARIEIVKKIMWKGKKIEFARQSGRPCESAISWIAEGDEA